MTRAWLTLFPGVIPSLSTVSTSTIETSRSVSRRNATLNIWISSRVLSSHARIMRRPQYSWRPSVRQTTQNGQWNSKKCLRSERSSSLKKETTGVRNTSYRSFGREKAQNFAHFRKFDSQIDGKRAFYRHLPLGRMATHLKEYYSARNTHLYQEF